MEVGKPSGSNQKFACDYLKVEVDNETVIRNR
ncbi:phage major tail tube protein [Fusobacterium nucleatum]